jgi:hypothetical protein
MAEPSRGLQISRRGWLLAGLTAPLLRAWAAGSLTVTFDGDNLHVSSPDLHFLSGKPLVRLKEGSTVEFVARITLYRDAWLTPWKHSDARFSLSYDVFEEDRFTVNMPGPPPRRAVNLSAAATEAWCLDKIWIAATGIAPDRQFWVRLDLGNVSQKDLSSVLGETGIRIDLVDVFSKPGEDTPITRQAGPLRLAGLARAPGGG